MTKDQIQISILMEIFDSENFNQSSNHWVDLIAQLPPDQKLILVIKPRFKIFQKSQFEGSRRVFKMDFSTDIKQLILDPVSLSGLTQIDCTATFMVVEKSSDCHNPQRHEISKNTTCQPKEVIK